MTLRTARHEYHPEDREIRLVVGTRVALGSPEDGAAIVVERACAVCGCSESHPDHWLPMEDSEGDTAYDCGEGA